MTAPIRPSLVAVVLFLALAGCGEGAPEPEPAANVIDTYINMCLSRVVDLDARVVCWKYCHGISCLPCADVAPGVCAEVAP